MKKIYTENKIELYNDFKKVYEKYYNEYKNSNISRDYYRKYGVYDERCVNALFGTFSNFREDAVNYLKLDEYYAGNTLSVKKTTNLLNNENKILKRELSKLELKDSVEHKILEIYKSSLENFDLTKLKVSDEIFKQETKKISIFNLSDWHSGEQIKKQELNGINEFNLEILKKRVDRIFNDFIFHNKTFGITETNLFFLGDILAGEIHRELERTNEDNVVNILFFVQEIIIEKLLFVAQFFNKINVVFIVGNHGRVKEGKPYYKEKVQMNWEYILAKQIKMIVDLIQKDDKEKKINIDVPESAFIIKDVNGRKFLLTHGEIFSGKGGGGFASIPYYSLVSSSAKMYGTLSQIGYSPEFNRFDDICIGHLHSDASVNLFNGGKMWINGCIIGTSEISLYGCKAISKIIQNMFVVNSFHNVHAVIPIYGVWENDTVVNI